MPEISLQIRNKVGLHARPAALFVQEAKKYKAQITLTRGNKGVNAKSILHVLSLGVGQGATVTLRAEGEDAEQALAGLSALNATNFGEAE